MTIVMVVLAPEGEFIIVYVMDSFLIFPISTDCCMEFFGKVYIDVDPRKGGIPFDLSVFCYFYELPKGVFDVLKSVQIPILTWMLEELNPGWGNHHVSCFWVKMFLPWMKV